MYKWEEKGECVLGIIPKAGLVKKKKKRLIDMIVNKPDPRPQAPQLRPLKCPPQSLDL